MDTQPTNKIALIKSIYFYLVSFVALMMVVFSAADAIDLALKQWVFTKADNNYYFTSNCDLNYAKPVGTDSTVKAPTAEECAKMDAQQKEVDKQNRESQRQRDAVRDISFLVVGIPLFLFHWRYARRKD